MKMQRATVRWEKAVEVEVFVPEGMTDEQILDIARTTDVDDWDNSEWEAWISATHETEVPDDRRKIVKCKLPGGHSFFDVAPDSPLSGAVVISDDGTAIVHPVDATWWIADEVES